MHESAEPRLSWVGIDVAKWTFDAAAWGHQPLRGMEVSTFPRTRAGVDAFAFWTLLRAGGAFGLVMEATGTYSVELAGWIKLRLPEARVAIVNPAHAHAFGRSLGLRSKTDDLDARMLAKMGEERQPEAWIPLEPVQARLREILRTRHKLVQMQATLRIRAEEGTAHSLARRAQEDLLASFASQIERLDQAVDHLMVEVPSLGEAIRLLQTIPGVGRLTAATVLGEAGDLRGYRRGKQLASYLGVSPRQHASGTSLHRRARMSRMGGGHARRTLFMAALSATQTDSHLGDFYRDLVARGKSKRLAIGALMRKLALLMRAVLIQGTPYASLTVRGSARGGTPRKPDSGPEGLQARREGPPNGRDRVQGLAGSR